MGSYVSSIAFQPPEVSYMHAKKHIIWLRTQSDATLPAFFIDRRSAVTVLFSHGNAEDLGMIYESFCDFAKEMNVNVLAYDYEGYGKASGSPSEKCFYEDIDAAYAFLIEVLKQQPENIVIYGRSIGSGPSCYLAERLAKANTPVGALILQSPLLSAFRVVFNFRFTLPGDMFPNVDRVPHIRCPLLVVHGTRDEVVPFWNGEGLFLQCPVQFRGKPFWVENAGHNNIESLLRDEGAFYEHIRSFLDDWLPAYRSRAVQETGSSTFSNKASMPQSSILSSAPGTSCDSSSIYRRSLME